MRIAISFALAAIIPYLVFSFIAMDIQWPLIVGWFVRFLYAFIAFIIFGAMEDYLTRW